MDHSHHGNRREGSLTGGIVLVVIGVYFLLWELGYIPGLHHLWPLILIIVGIVLIYGHLRGSRPGRRERPATGRDDLSEM